MAIGEAPLPSEVGTSVPEWELMLRSQLGMMADDERAEAIGTLMQLVRDWEEESGLGLLKYQTN